MKEIRRVLKPGGDVLAMLYNRSSINYQLEIKVLRKLGVRLLEAPGLITLLGAMGLPREKLERHRGLRRCGRKMTEQEWLSRNTDGPDNPYSAVYGRDEANRLFRDFHVIANEVFYFNHEHWGPLGRALPAKAREALGRRWGWHRIIYARKP